MKEYREKLSKNKIFEKIFTSHKKQMHLVIFYWGDCFNWILTNVLVTYKSGKKILYLLVGENKNKKHFYSVKKFI